MVDNEHRGPVQTAGSAGASVDRSAKLFAPKDEISDVYGLAPEEDAQTHDDADAAPQPGSPGWRDKLAMKRSGASKSERKAQGAIASAFGKQLPDRVVIGHLVTDRSKEALIAARDAVAKHLSFPNLSWVHVERFRDGYFYEAHERGSGHSFLPDLVNALTLYPDRYAWIPHGDRVVKIELKGDRIKTTLMTPQQSKIIRSGDVAPLTQSRKMREAISKGDRVLAVGLSVAAVGLVAFGLALFVRSSLNSTVAMPEMVLTDYLPHSQFRILNRIDTRRYVEKIEYDGSRWSIGYQDVPSMLAGAERETEQPATTVPGLLERAREMILPGSSAPAPGPESAAPGMIQVAPAAPPVPGQATPAEIEPVPPQEIPSEPAAAAPEQPPQPVIDEAPPVLVAPPIIQQSNPDVIVDPSRFAVPGDGPTEGEAPRQMNEPDPAEGPVRVDPEVAAPDAAAPERLDPEVAAPPAPAPAEVAPPAASEGPRVISPEERRRRIEERNSAARRALAPRETNQ